MYRFVAILIVLSLSQFASAESVSFGASLDPDGGHIGGSASSVSGPATGRVHWAGKAITIDTGFILPHFVHLEGTVTRSNDPSLEGQAVMIDAIPGTDTIIVTIGELSYAGAGHVTVR